MLITLDKIDQLKILVLICFQFFVVIQPLITETPLLYHVQLDSTCCHVVLATMYKIMSKNSDTQNQSVTLNVNVMTIMESNAMPGVQLYHCLSLK